MKQLVDCSLFYKKYHIFNCSYKKIMFLCRNQDQYINTQLLTNRNRQEIKNTYRHKEKQLFCRKQIYVICKYSLNPPLRELSVHINITNQHLSYFQSLQYLFLPWKHNSTASSVATTNQIKFCFPQSTKNIQQAIYRN